MSGNGFTHSLRPDEVRRRNFTVRFRGLDRNEVHGFLNCSPTTWLGSTSRSTTGWDDCRSEHARGCSERAAASQVNPQEQVTDQAVLLLNQAQQLADALIDEGMQSARDLLMAARHSPARRHRAGQRGRPRSGRPGHGARQRRLRHNGVPSSDVEDVRMFAKVAQVQFRAVLDALDEQVNRLGQFSEAAERAKLADEQDWLPRATPRRSELDSRPMW